MPGKRADAFGKLLISAFLIWVVVDAACGPGLFTNQQLLLLVTAAVAFWLAFGFRKKT